MWRCMERTASGRPPEALKAVPGGLVASGISLTDDVARNSVWLSSLPDTRGNHAHRYLPYYLYPLPRAWILDILQGRLVLLSVLNVGRVAVALENEGLRTADARGRTYLRVFSDIDLDGALYAMKMPSINDGITRIVFVLQVPRVGDYTVGTFTLHYHVGPNHYTATYRDSLEVCVGATVAPGQTCPYASPSPPAGSTFPGAGR